MGQQINLNGKSKSPLADIKITPTNGLWEIALNDDGTFFIDEENCYNIEVKESNSIIAMIPEEAGGLNDARLIAASKELYASLRMILEDMFAGFKDLEDDEKEVLLNSPAIAGGLLALKKATGV